MTILVVTESVTYFQFQFPHLVCFYTAVKVKWLPIIYRKFRKRITFKYTVNANELGTYALSVSLYYMWGSPQWSRVYQEQCIHIQTLSFDNLYSPPSGREKGKNNHNLTKPNYYNIHSTISPRNQQNEVLQNTLSQTIVDRKFPTTLFNQYTCMFGNAKLSAAVVYYTSILFVRNNLIKKRLTTKSNELLSDLRNGHAPKPYRKIGIHFVPSYVQSAKLPPQMLALLSFRI